MALSQVAVHELYQTLFAQPTQPQPPQQPQPTLQYDPETPEVELNDYYQRPIFAPNSPSLICPYESPPYAPTLDDGSDNHDAHDARTRSSLSLSLSTPVFAGGRVWTLDIVKLLEAVDSRVIEQPCSAEISRACETVIGLNNNCVYVDCVLLRLVPPTLFDAETGPSLVEHVASQVRGFGTRASAVGELSPLSKFTIPKYDLERCGFVGLSKQNMIAAVPFRFAGTSGHSVNSKQLLILEPVLSLPAAANTSACFLAQTSALCRALKLSSVPTLSRLACEHNKLVDAESQVAVSRANETFGHPVLRVFRNDRRGLGSALRNLRHAVGERGGLEKFLSEFISYDSAFVSMAAYSQWALGLKTQLLTEAWPLCLESLEKRETELVVELAASSNSSSSPYHPYSRQPRSYHKKTPQTSRSKNKKK
jgi:hypothetical protein